ncbi:transposase family protein [Streptomyces mirabilis]|uniref:transposase family protein n=1 Tax=Streptomyces mirabilis TaxID=68239 RepID=UPI0036DBC498
MLAEVVEYLGAGGMTGIIDGTEIRVRCPAIGRKDRDTFISGKSKQNAAKTMVVTDGDGHVLFCSPASPGSCVDITHARQSGLVKLLETRLAIEIRGCWLPGSRCADRRAGGDPAALQVQVERSGLVRGHARAQCKAHSSRRIGIEHGIARLQSRAGTVLSANL